MNNEKKQAPRCPWCGYMMRLRKLNNNDTVYAAYYRCTNCNAPSPQVYAGGAEDVESKAYKAATSPFCNPGNRELTLEEVLEIASSDYAPRRESQFYGWRAVARREDMLPFQIFLKKTVKLSLNFLALALMSR
jgi:hypothetical protein|nr:MAG TPA: RNA polymerase III-like protein [Caudoviricetes sp.]